MFFGDIEIKPLIFLKDYLGLINNYIRGKATLDCIIVTNFH